MNHAVLIQPQINHQIDSLLQLFLSLSQPQQTSLAILAVAYQPLSTKQFAQVMSLLREREILPKTKKDYGLSSLQVKQYVTQTLLIKTNDGLQVNKILASTLIEQIDNSNLSSQYSSTQKVLEIVMATQEVVPAFHEQSMHRDSPAQEMNMQRLIRDLFYLGQLKQLEEALAFNKNPQIINHTRNQVLIELNFLPFNLSHFITLSNDIQYQAFATLLRTCQKQGLSCQYPITLLEEVCKHKSPNDNCVHLLAEQYLFQMRLDDFNRISNTDDTSSYALQLQGAYRFIKGQNQQAIAYFEQALLSKNTASKNTASKRNKQYLGEVLGYFYKLALLVQGNQSDAAYFTSACQQVEYEEADRKADSDFYYLGQGIVKPAKCLATGEKYAINIKYNSADEEIDFFCHQLSYFNYLLAHIWCNQSKDITLADLADKYQANFEQLDYSLFANICEQMAASFRKLTTPAKQEIADVTKFISAKSEWDLALDKLIALNPNVTPESRTIEPIEKPVRLIWELVPDFGYSLTAREQKLNKSGWSKGRTVALKRLKEETGLFGYLSDNDKRICRAISVHRTWGYYPKLEYTLQGLTALNAAVGIDNLYKQNELNHNIELSKREPELLVTEQGDQLCLSIADLSHDIDSFDEHDDDAQDTDEQDSKSSSYTLKAISDNAFQLTVFSAEHLKVAKIIGEGGLLIPISAKQKALDGISAVAPFLNIQSDISELDTGLAHYECDPNLVVNIQPIQHGLAFTCVVMPFGENGPAFKPAVGNASLSADINGKRMATQRDLVREETMLDQLDHYCPAFLDMPDNVLLVDDLQFALAALEQLEAGAQKSDFDLILRWPKGKKISLSKALESKHLQLAISKKSEWFDITGNLQVNNEQVIELRKLLELVKTSNGRFIQLDNEQVLALSEDLRHKLDQINQVSDDGTFHPLASFQIEEASAGMRMKTIHAWDQQTQKMHQANAITPQIPSTFQAQLRDYQLAGFDWATRLAHWGAGACLADDMGLGKTLQALAVLLDRAGGGPSLVIAPTSVCFNWQQEAAKFSPTLKLKMFADATTTRQRIDLLDALSPFDCVVISYGLLQRETDILKQVEWHTIVADEAQALKNPLSKRTKAAIALNGRFKMITTGTPIENDLTELWSLFRFINPGLLGNLKAFNQRYSQPIENVKEDKLAARKASLGLKTLIQPFILRRMKNQVLTELPSRTDINIQVEMSAKERDFYEALRLNAIDNISESGRQGNAGEQRIRMLAELVKLRQACCHPKLVMAETDIPSAKLDALNELLQDLKLNKHKALIFSQFVGHLQLIKQHLEAQGFSYQYLDGATPQKERQKRVNAFQAGDGDIFLISLKAGGSGLNLTAADYVIHMDPWWNPAVEEQASDRAHRMGQKRPVTIYRLIAKNTIEEKIVAMHKHKRDLADRLLSGNEAASKLSVEDMLNLLKETF